MLFILGNGSCDFEADWCGWHEDSASNDSRWHRTMDEEPATTLEWSWWGEFAKLCQAHLTIYANIFGGFTFLFVFSTRTFEDNIRVENFRNATILYVFL